LADQPMLRVDGMNGEKLRHYSTICLGVEVQEKG
jgi:hypothetical protein